MEDGAILEGSCSMMKARETMERRIAEANAPKITNELAPFQENEPNGYFELNDDETAEAATN
jgi:hypothetical protein